MTENNNITRVECDKQLYKEGKCHPNCNWFPDMNIRDSGEWTWSDSGEYKIRKNKKCFKCLYDDQPITWDRECPRVKVLKEIQEKLSEEKILKA